MSVDIAYTRKKKPHKAHKRWFSRKRNIFNIYTKLASDQLFFRHFFVCRGMEYKQYCSVSETQGRTGHFTVTMWCSTVIKGDGGALNVFVHKNQIFMCTVSVMVINFISTMTARREKFSRRRKKWSINSQTSYKTCGKSHWVSNLQKKWSEYRQF